MKLAYRRSIRFGPDTPDSRRAADLSLFAVSRPLPANRLLRLKTTLKLQRAQNTVSQYRLSGTSLTMRTVAFCSIRPFPLLLFDFPNLSSISDESSDC